MGRKGAVNLVAGKRGRTCHPGSDDEKVLQALGHSSTHCAAHVEARPAWLLQACAETGDALQQVVVITVTEPLARTR